MATSARTVIARARFPLLALALLSMVTGMWAGLLDLGWHLPRGPVDIIALHGPLMVFGFLGTVVSLERAVALKRSWGFLAPAACIVGTVLLFCGAPQAAGELLLLAAGIVLVLLFAVIVRIQPNAANRTLMLASLLWVAGVALWLAGLPLVRVIPWWVGFLVVTILGERLELAAFGQLTGRGRWLFTALTSALLASLIVLSFAALTDVGIRMAGVAFAGYVVWLARFDIARRTVRRPGLPRFVALALLPGYAWLGVAGVLWVWHGAVVDGPLHDAELHAIFLGFVFSMIFGHAPVIFPGVLGVPIPFRTWFYGHLALLHVGLALRISGDLLGSPALSRDGGLLNATAILLFLAATAASAVGARIARQ